ncbi:MAG: PBP1A family penicillin-binding protein [Firmicutes bacterium]|nr:PBP1A family penicillin-binding protein [Bacillota bacterium]
MAKSRNKKRSLSIYLLVILGSTILGASLGVFSAYLKSAPSLDQINIRQDFTTYLYDIEGRLITDLYKENRVPVDITELPEHVKNAVVAIEDDQFYNHHGINFTAFGRAILVNLRDWSFSQGGGTITMQLARNVFLTQKKTIMRKLEEFLWAVQIERKYSKDEILEAYLNEFYLNHGVYGIEAGARTFFGKSAKDLNVSEAALIAGIIRWPSRYSPFVNPEIAVDRRNFVLARMEELNYLTPAQAKEAKNEPLLLAEKQERVLRARYFVDYVTQQLIDRYGEAMVFGGGLRVYTTLDLEMQAIAEKALQEGLPINPNHSGSLVQPQGAFLALVPQTGEIRVMIGGRGEDRFNRSVQALRAPGSAIKVFLYTAAVDRGITAAHVYVDEPTEFTMLNGEIWSPQNYYGTFAGEVTVREAIEDSLNVIAAKVANELGPQTVIDYAKKMGISTFVEQGRVNDVALAPLALGGMTKGVSPLELATAYGVLANQGIKTEPTAILRVTDANGNILEEHQKHQKVVLSEQTSYLMTDLLRGVIERGTGKNANIGRPAAGKTGTHQDYRDAWFVGYVPDLVAVVWFGEDNPERMVYQGVRYGSWDAATIWGNFMREALKNKPIIDFPKPAGLVEGLLIDTKTGLLVSDDCNLPPEETRREIFIKGSEPTEYSPRCSRPWWQGLPFF